MIVGQQAVKEKEWLETLKIFGIGKEDEKKIIYKLGYTAIDNNFSDVTGATQSGPPVACCTQVSGESHIGPCLPVVFGALGDGEKHNNGDTPLIYAHLFISFYYY
jgi:hypothetical protein